MINILTRFYYIMKQFDTLSELPDKTLLMQPLQIEAKSPQNVVALHPDADYCYPKTLETVERDHSQF